MLRLRFYVHWKDREEIWVDICYPPAGIAVPLSQMCPTRGYFKRFFLIVLVSTCRKRLQKGVHSPIAMAAKDFSALGTLSLWQFTNHSS